MKLVSPTSTVALLIKQGSTGLLFAARLPQLVGASMNAICFYFKLLKAQSLALMMFYDYIP